MPGLLEVVDLSVAFGDTFEVGPVSFAAGRGIVHVQGPNGSGKTTLIRALCGELRPSTGRVLVGGQDVHRSVQARRLIALVPSIPELPGFLSISEAYEFTAAIRGAPDWDGAAYCAELGLDRRLPLASASAGQRRKAELVCGLAGDPPILLLDETFAHLDDESVSKLEDWLLEWSASRLILLTHHGAPPVPVDAVLRVVGRDVEFRWIEPNEVPE